MKVGIHWHGVGPGHEGETLNINAQVIRSHDYGCWWALADTSTGYDSTKIDEWIRNTSGSERVFTIYGTPERFISTQNIGGRGIPGFEFAPVNLDGYVAFVDWLIQKYNFEYIEPWNEAHYNIDPVVAAKMTKICKQTCIKYNKNTLIVAPYHGLANPDWPSGASWAKQYLAACTPGDFDLWGLHIYESTGNLGSILYYISTNTPAYKGWKKRLADLGFHVQIVSTEGCLVDFVTSDPRTRPYLFKLWRDLHRDSGLHMALWYAYNNKNYGWFCGNSDLEKAWNNL